MAATGVVVGSGADFSASSANPDNQFTAGVLSMTNSKSPNAILSANNLKPGDVTTGTVDIENTGSILGDFTLRRSALTDTVPATPLSGQLNVVVKDCGEWPNNSTPEACDDGDDATLSSTKLNAFPASIDLGEYGVNEKHTYKFTVELDAAAGDAYENGSSTATFTWDATQS